MNIGEVCTREVYIVTPGEALTQAAREMLRRHVGAIVVVQPQGKLVLPVGIVTDRDIVREQLSRDADLHSLKVADVMSKDLLTLAETSEVSEAIERMSSKAVRRAPVVSGSGDLVGIVSLDDLLAVMMEEFSGLARLVAAQPKRERVLAQGATPGTHDNRRGTPENAPQLPQRLRTRHAHVQWKAAALKERASELWAAIARTQVGTRGIVWR